MLYFVTQLLFVMLLVVTTTGCDLIEGVVKFSLWTILIIIVLVVLLVYGLIKGLFG